MRQQLGETWIDDEELAYSSPDGGLRGSKRKGLVRMPDGRLGKVTLAIPDTYSTIPARKSDGAVGYVSLDRELGTDDAGEFVFHPYTKGSEMYEEYHKSIPKKRATKRSTRRGTPSVLGGVR